MNSSCSRKTYKQHMDLRYVVNNNYDHSSCNCIQQSIYLLSFNIVCQYLFIMEILHMVELLFFLISGDSSSDCCDIFWLKILFQIPRGITQGGLSGLLTLHQHRANNQYRTANQIQPTLTVSSNTQATIEQSPIQVVLTKFNAA